MIGTPLCHPEGRGEIKSKVKLSGLGKTLSIEVCCRGLHTLTLVKTKIRHISLPCLRQEAILYDPIGLVLYRELGNFLN